MAPCGSPITIYKEDFITLVAMNDNGILSLMSRQGRIIQELEGYKVYELTISPLDIPEVLKSVSVVPLVSATLTLHNDDPFSCLLCEKENTITAVIFFQISQSRESTIIFSYWGNPGEHLAKSFAFILLVARQQTVAAGLHEIKFRYHEGLSGHKFLISLLSKLGPYVKEVNDYRCRFPNPENLLESPWFNRSVDNHLKIEIWNENSFQKLQDAWNSGSFDEVRQPLNPLKKIYLLDRNHSALLFKAKKLIGWCIMHEASPSLGYLSTFYVKSGQAGFIGLNMVKACVAHSYSVRGYYKPFSFSVESFNEKMYSLVKRVLLPLGVKENIYYNLVINLDNRRNG